jgi:hypothetical protein
MNAKGCEFKEGIIVESQSELTSGILRCFVSPIRLAYSQSKNPVARFAEEKAVDPYRQNLPCACRGLAHKACGFHILRKSISVEGSPGTMKVVVIFETFCRFLFWLVKVHRTRFRHLAVGIERECETISLFAIVVVTYTKVNAQRPPFQATQLDKEPNRPSHW